ncbi:hypothetical protein [Micromonospora globispora]|uniref:hypothetical protein n=1 Tax=Micromonospora globispora TaxID=1450148 RepID=UPI000F5FFE0C|nr:hypothetical protein [Micromonospora globispora]
MGSELERKDDREISISVEVGTGAFLPGGKIAMAFKRAWQHRADEYLESVAAAADIEEEEVIESVAQGGAFSDVFADGLRAITSQSDDVYRNTFAHFVASALNDPAAIDIVSFLLEKFGKLRPPHIRVFWSICLLAVEVEQKKSHQPEERRLVEERPREKELGIAGSAKPRSASDQRGGISGGVSISGVVAGSITNSAARLQRQYTPDLWHNITIDMEAFSKQLGLPRGVVTSLMGDLFNEGILGDEDGPRVSVTELGRLAYETVGEGGMSRIIFRS